MHIFSVVNEDMDPVLLNLQHANYNYQHWTISPQSFYKTKQCSWSAFVHWTLQASATTQTDICLWLQSTSLQPIYLLWPVTIPTSPDKEGLVSWFEVQNNFLTTKWDPHSDRWQTTVHQWCILIYCRLCYSAIQHVQSPTPSRAHL